jgi:hypothetical protein
MSSQKGIEDVRLDMLGLLLAGLINTFLAFIDAALILGPGTASLQPEVLDRAGWIAEHTLRWQAGWSFWFAVTLSFAWSYYALGRHLRSSPPWRSLAIGLALIAAAVDLVGVLVNMAVLPTLAEALIENLNGEVASVLVVFQSMENLANALINVVAFGMYSLAGLLLLPAMAATKAYPRWLVWLGTAEWGIASIAALLLVVSPNLATVPLLVSFLLYAPWVWGSGFWLYRKSSPGNAGPETFG